MKVVQTYEKIQTVTQKILDKLMFLKAKHVEVQEQDCISEGFKEIDNTCEGPV